MLSFIIWDADPILVTLGGFEARWYGLFFAMAFVVGQYIITRIFLAEGKTERQVESLTLFMIVSTVVGARLGHCLFYDADYYLANPLEILKVWKGGLASHGAAFAIIVAMLLWARREKTTALWILDRIVIVVALGGAFIRMGNLMNAEIVGKPTDVPWAFVFTHPIRQAIEASQPEGVRSLSFHKTGKAFTTEGGDPRVLVQADLQAPGVDPQTLTGYGERQLPTAIMSYDEAHMHAHPEDAETVARLEGDTLKVDIPAVPRHPAQLYEALSCVAIFLALYATWARRKAALPEGRLFGWFVVGVFGLRFVYEFLKEPQVDFETELPYNMGQFLSIPLVIIGLYVLLRSYRQHMHTRSGDAIS